MSNYSLIPSPPPELMEEWRMDYIGRGHAFIDVATKVIQWGADQELEACIEWVSIQLNCTDQEHLVPHLRAARRHKPPSLKEEALKLLPEIRGEEVRHLCPLEVATIRRALEALPND